MRVPCCVLMRCGRQVALVCPAPQTRTDVAQMNLIDGLMYGLTIVVILAVYFTLRRKRF